MDTQYNLAAVAQQKENAAELAKAKEAERDALL
jgi:tRNA A37 threonylcarbamoyladenosine synthetase subunit TsaC/SUA5/YrdC